VRRILGCKIVVGVPEETFHVRNDEQQITQYYNKLEPLINGAPGIIAYHFDEVGFDS
jgi:hypothetical protein